MNKIIKKMEVYDKEGDLLYIKEYNKQGKEIHHKSATILYKYNDNGETHYKISLGNEYWISYGILGNMISYTENENIQEIFNNKDRVTEIINSITSNNYTDKELLINIKSYGSIESYKDNNLISYYKYNQNNDIVKIITQDGVIETRIYEYYY